MAPDDTVTPPSEEETSQLLHVLAAVPRQIEALADGLEDARLQRPPHPDAWSANEILDHLRACADIWGDSIAAMLEQTHPRLRYVSPRSRIKHRRYADLEFRASLRAYASQRADLVGRLQGLAGSDWSRGGTFTGGSRRRAETVLSYVRRIVQHEAEHLKQIRDALAAP